MYKKRTFWSMLQRSKRNKEQSKEGKQKKESGFTLIELILVIAVGASIIIAAMVLYNKSRDSAVANTNTQNLQAIMAGLSEYRTYKGNLPVGDGTSWPAAIQNYVDTGLQTQYKYTCASGVATLTTPVADSSTQATRMLSKLKDMGMCDATSAINGTTDTEIDCVLKSFNGSAGC